MNLKIDLQKADWSTAYVNDLPDSAFLYIQAGGEKDSEGKTKPRTLRHFPYKDSSGKVDLIHVRNAIARIPQSTFGLSSEQMKTLQNRARQYLKKDKVMDKSLTIDLEKAVGGKYKQRIAKPGGGYRYIYEDDKIGRETNKKIGDAIIDSLTARGGGTWSIRDLVYKNDRFGNATKKRIDLVAQELGKRGDIIYNSGMVRLKDKNKIEYPEGKTVSRGINKNNDGTYTAMTYSQSKDFKTRKGAEKWLESRGINPDGTKKSIGDNDMDKAFSELNDFLKSTIEDEGQPTIGTGKEQGAAMGLDGKGENKGIPGTGSGTPEVGGPPKSKVDKLSEDDEVDEDNMKPHKKPIEKSLPLNTWNQVEYMQREHRMYRDACENSDGDIDFSKAMGGKYKQRIAKPGGGYKYIYEDSDKGRDLKSTLKDLAGNTVVITEKDGKFSADHSSKHTGDIFGGTMKTPESVKDASSAAEALKRYQNNVNKMSHPVINAVTMKDGKVQKVHKLKNLSWEKSLSSDDQVVELLKSEQYIAAGNSSALGFYNQLVQQRVCPNCEGHFMKALTVCPYCGN